MKKLSFALACAASAAVFATTIDSIGFEAYTAGFTGLSLKTDAGGEGAATDSHWLYEGSGDGSVVKAYGGENLAVPTGSNLSGTPGLNYLELSTEGGTLWRSINTLADATSMGAAQAVGADGLFVDTMVQFTPTEDGGTPDTTAGDKLAIWLNVDSSGANPVTNLMVRAAKVGYANSAEVVTPTTFALANTSDIQPGTWYRLTVKAIPDVTKAISDGERSTGITGYQIFLDGTLLSTADTVFESSYLDWAYEDWLEDADQTLLASGSVFGGLDGFVTTSTLQAVGFKGSGAIDELVFTETNPLPAPVETFEFTITAGAMTDVEWSADTGTTWTTYASGAKAAEGSILIRFKNGDGAQKTVTKTVASEGSNTFDVSDETFGWPEYLGEAVDGAYTIDNLADLVLFQKGVNNAKLETAGVTFKLTDDIAISETWTGIGAYGKDNTGKLNDFKAGAFQGTFDGGNFAITGLKLKSDYATGAATNKYIGFFFSTYGATIQNVKFGIANYGWDNGKSVPQDVGGGIVAGTSWNTTYDTVEVLKGTDAGTDEFYGTHAVAALAAYTTGTNTFTDCVNNVNISENRSSSAKAAAFTACTQNNGATLVFDGCVNKGNIHSTKGSYIGGFCGYNQGAATFKDCSNQGSVTTDATSGCKMAQFAENESGGTAACLGGCTGTDALVAVNTAASGFTFATVNDHVATFVADTALVAGDTYKVMATGGAPTIELAADETISFDTALATIDDTGITAATGAELTSDKTTPVWTYSAAVPAPAYPTYIGDNTEKQGWYDVWKGTYAEDSDSSKEEQFLLNITPAADAAAIAAAKAAFAITAIEPDGKGGWTVTVAGDKGDGDRYGNGRIEIQGATTLNGPWAPNTAGAKFFKAVLK